MHKLFRSYSRIIVVVGSLVAACSQVTPDPSVPTFNAVNTATAIAISPTISTPTATIEPTIGAPRDITPWPLSVQLLSADQLRAGDIPSWEQSTTPSEQLLKLQPGISTLKDVYGVLGHPSRRRDFPEGVVLGYGAVHTYKYWHTILLDGIDGTVLLVTIVGNPEDAYFPTLDALEAKYGEPVLAVTNYSWKHLFFDTKDIATLGGLTQVLPPNTTLQQYQAHNGYFWISLAFTP
jgi:hypothetical protein